MIHALLVFLIFNFHSRPESAMEYPGILKDSLNIPILDYDELRPLLHLNNDTTYVINFWATWCAPCVKELPHFTALDSLYEDEAFKLVLVSLDFKKDYRKKLQPFVDAGKLNEYVLVLEDSRSNFWIDDIDKSWGGSIPATLVYRGQNRAFYERTFDHVQELSDIVEPFLNR